MKVLDHQQNLATRPLNAMRGAVAAFRLVRLRRDCGVLMRSIDQLGVFWLEDHEDDVLSGRLTFDPSGSGVDLQLVGSFDAHDRNHRTNVRIFGWIGNDKVTLDDCWASNSNFRAPGPEEVTYYANEMFVGHHLSGELAFDSVYVMFEDLGSWVQRSAIDVNQSEDRYQITCNSVEVESSPFSGGSISLHVNWNAPGDKFTGISVTQWPVFKIAYSERQSFDAIQEDVGRLESLISLCTDTPIVDVSLKLQRADARVRMLDGSESSHLQLIEHLSSRINYKPTEKRKQRRHHRMLLDYQELGGISSVATWMDKSALFTRPLHSLMSTQRARQMFMENKFMNVTYAAEALHRALIGGGQGMDTAEFEELIAAYTKVTPEVHRDWLLEKMKYINGASLPKRLNQLAQRAGAATRDLIGDRKRWAQTVATVRNELTHLKEGASSANGGDLYRMAESVYAVARICMLLEAGVPAEVLDRKANEWHMLWYKHDLAATIAKVRSGFSKNGE
ncbi:hypothetical protein FXN61_35350 [Lentzea sp. PSKA42]|uniref:ApeA N-terminal domain-containing protein n=1 Tax=Lentzea indica TaxID=2604800 RepID=A0ABX1FRX0_9PSEU|nr:HEPN domain-containing protein [Lentzea indica]NKE61754.1 hypothetical protein [Lentzea indica]